MSPSPFNGHIASQAVALERTPSYAPTPGDFGREYSPSINCLSPSPIYGGRSPLLPGQAVFLDEAEDSSGNSGVAYDEDASTIIYLIKWRVTLNNRVLAKDTEQDLVSKPSSYWQQIKEKAEHVVHRKKARNQRVRPDDTTIVVSVNDRSQRDLTKHFEGTDIDWSPIESQLVKWGALCRQGKKLRLSISINYAEDGKPSPSKRTDKRGTSSVTKRMLRDREDQIDAEDASGQPSVWRDVYRKMRCPGPPCHHEGQYCWLDPVGKKHYKLRTHHMRALVKYVEQGGIIDTHDDIPDTLRDQLYAEEQQRLQKQQKAPGQLATGSMFPPININVLPSSQPLISSSSGAETSPARTTQDNFINIPGLLEVAVEEYTNWQLARVSTEIFEDNIKKARDITLENCLDLKQIYFDQDPDFFVKRGVKIGVARRFVSDISLWRKHCEQNKDWEDNSD